MSEKEEEIQVRDRRRFSAKAGEAPGPAAEPPPRPSPKGEGQKAPAGGGPDPFTPPGPGLDFSSFILGLSTQALMLLGEIADPQSGQAHRDLGGAKQMIDILGLLQEKTKGNLVSKEQQLLEHILFDLRMKYVDATRRK